MRKFIVAPILVFIAAPALATQGLTCSASGKGAPSVGLVIGHAAEPGIAQTNLFDGNKDVPVAISQAWLDDRRAWVNLGDPDLMALVAKDDAQRGARVRLVVHDKNSGVSHDQLAA